MADKTPQYVHHEEGYGNNASEQQAFASSVLSDFTECLAGVNASPGETFTVCDYGAADGKTSVQFMKACRRHLDSHLATIPELCWVFNDLPGTGFNNIRKEIKAKFIETYPENSKVFALTSAGSFYEQVMPTEFVHFGLCLTAVHWLSKSPNISKDMDLTMQHQMTKEVAAKDWEIFLLRRAKELKPGGRLLITVMAVKRKSASPHICVYEAVKRLHVMEVITQDEFSAMTMPRVFNRSEGDIRLPFEAAGRHTATKAGLRLLKVDRHENQYIMYKQWQQAGGKSNPTATGKIIQELIDHLKTFCHSYLSVLSETRSKEEEDLILQAFYQNVKTYLTENLDKFDMAPPFYAVQIEKTLTQDPQT